MSSRVLVETLRAHADARGSVWEPLEPDGFAAQRNCHVVLTAPGEIRGNHYHPRGTEVLTVVGPARVRAKKGEDVTDTDVPAGQVMRFTFPPGVSHAILNTGGAPMLIVAFNTVEHDASNPDVVRDVILEP